MNNIIYLIGLVVVVVAILGFFGLRWQNAYRASHIGSAGGMAAAMYRVPKVCHVLRSRRTCAELSLVETAGQRVPSDQGRRHG